MSTWKLTVGMEIHVELETKSKMFCGCANVPFGSAPNTHVCPVCYGLPGALPLLNREAIAMVVRFGQAIAATIATETFWARKNYFYPDLPKGYQISQSTHPLVVGGTVTIDGTDYHLDHAHLEEDAGKLMHGADQSHSLVNYNRAGVPLLEIVTRPDFHSAAAAKLFCQELQRIMRSLKISSADMEKGRMRCEANISVSQTDELGQKVEVKNINSFRAVEKAIEYEFDRQVAVLEAGEAIKEETRTWNDPEGKTVSMRSKESMADYRYFPEPDLPWVKIEAGQAAEHLLPDQQRARLTEIGLPKETIQAVIDKNGFELVTTLAKKDPAIAVEAGKLLLAVPEFTSLLAADQEKVIVLRQANGWPKDTVAELVKRAVNEHKPIDQLATEYTHDDDLGDVIQSVIAANPGPVADFKAGKEPVFQFLVGQVMAKTKGRANIQRVREELQNALSG